MRAKPKQNCNSMTKITIEKVFTSSASKEGKPFLDRFTQQPQIKVSLLTKEYGKTYLSNFVKTGDPSLAWKQGDVVDVLVEEKNGYTNWRHPKQGELLYWQLVARVEALEDMVESLNLKIK